MTPRDYLLVLRSKQQNLPGWKPWTGPVEKPKVWQDTVSPELDAMVEAEHRRKAGEYGSDNDVLLNRLKQMIEETSTQRLRDDFAVGELFLTYPQARVIRVGSQGYVIALHMHLCDLMRYVTLTGITRLRLDAPLQVPARITREKMYPWFDQYVRYFLLNEGSQPGIPVPVDRSDMIMEELVYVSSLLWIIAHEYGHYLAGHLERADSFCTTRIPGAAVEMHKGGDEPHERWEEEYEADVIGADLLVNAVEHEAFYYAVPGDTPPKDRRAYAMWGVDSAIAMLALVDRRHVLSGEETHEPGSHPAAHLRLRNLRAQRPSLFFELPIYTSIVTGYFDAIYKGLPGTHGIREP